MNTKKATELKQRQHDIELQLQGHTDADEKFSYTLKALIDIGSRANELFEVSKVEQNRQLINFALSNLELKGKNLDCTLNKPFDMFVTCQTRSDWLGLVEGYRTFCRENIQIIMTLKDEIKLVA